MNLDGVSLAPGSAIEGSYLSGSMKDSIVGDLSLQNSYLLSEGMFKGTNISNVGLEGAIPRNKDIFAGATYNGQELTGEALEAFWQEKSPSFGNVGQSIAATGQHHAAATTTAKETRGAGDMAALSSTDGLLNALCEASGLLGQCGVSRNSSDAAHDSDPLEQDGVSIAQLNEINQHRVEHDAGIGHSYG